MAATYSSDVNGAQVSVLDRPVYGLSDAASLLGLNWSRARAWLDGYERKSVRYPPVVRPCSTGETVVSWGEFVELGYLREYRRKGVPLQRLRPVIEALREEFQTPYPLATAKPYVGDRELVMKLQEDKRSSAADRDRGSQRSDCDAGPGGGAVLQEGRVRPAR